MIHWYPFIMFFSLAQTLDADQDLNMLTEDFEKHRTEILCGYD